MAKIATNPNGCPANTNSVGIECCISVMMPGPYVPEEAEMFHWAHVRQPVDPICGKCYLQFDLGSYRLPFIKQAVNDISVVKPTWIIEHDVRVAVFQHKEIYACPNNFYCALVRDPDLEHSTECQSNRRPNGRSDGRPLTIRHPYFSAQNDTVHEYLDKVSY